MGSGRETGSRIPLAADPACRPLTFSIVLTDREPGTGYFEIIAAVGFSRSVPVFTVVPSLLWPQRVNPIAWWIWGLGANSPEEKLNSNLSSLFTCFSQKFYFETIKRILAKSLQV